MQFVYHKNSGEKYIQLRGESFHHLFRARRMRKLESLTLRNLKDCNAYIYVIENLDKKEATLILKDIKKDTQAKLPKGHLIWAIIDPKNIEKALPFLNELNLFKITFFYADFSQKHFVLDLERIHRILENSCAQCGRTTLLEIEILKNLQDVLQNYSNLAVMDFLGKPLQTPLELPILIGAEGGFSQNERTLLQEKNTFSAPNCNILRSETAAIYAASKFF